MNASKSDRFVCASLANNIMPFLDGLPHKEQRRQVARVFQKEFKAFLPRLTALAEEAVAALHEEVKVIHDFAHPFALKMICEILGIPVDERLRVWSGSFFYLFTKIPSAAVREEVDEHLSAFRSWVIACFRTPDKSGVLAALSDLVQAGDLPEPVAVDTIILLFADGLENVDSGIGNALLAFARNPSEWDKLRGKENLIPRAVEEILRYDSPAQYIARTCLEDFSWQGHHFKKDLTVILLLASANHDPEVFDSPESFNLSRSPNPHLSFGHGKHSCLGSRLVEHELTAILFALRKRVRKIILAGEIRWRTRTGHRWMEEGHFRLSN